MREIWKDIKGFEGHYMVSNLGRIKTLNYKRKKTEKILTTTINNGYPFIVLWNKDKGYGKKVHRLVAEAFIPNPENKPCVDHINTIRDDNRVENLRWCNHSENLSNSLTKEKRKNCRTCKPIKQLTQEGFIVAIYNSLSEASEKTGYNKGNIGECANGKKYKTVGGYKWEYIN